MTQDSRESYAKDDRLLFTFLWARGKNWDEAEPDDIQDFHAWRRRSEDNPSRIGGAKWARELAAFTQLYAWAVGNGYMVRSPVLTHTVRLRDGGSAEVADEAPKDVRASNVKWLTPRTMRRWQDVGIRGYGPDGLPDPSWRGRNDGRNGAFTDTLVDSGLRLKECGCLLTVEVPQALAGDLYPQGTVAGAIAKRRERMFYTSVSSVQAIRTYMEISRRAAVRRARRAGRYDRMPGRRQVTSLSPDRRLTWTDASGHHGEGSLSTLTAWERARLLVEGPDGLEPLWLWLGENGMPLDYHSWEKVFSAASQRCERLGIAIRCSPKTCRHSFALKMLVTIQLALDRRMGLDQSERDYTRKLYGDAFPLVRDLLGHRSEETTRNIYLEPLNGIRLRQILDDSEDLDEILGRVAAADRRVLDVAPPGPGEVDG